MRTFKYRAMNIGFQFGRSPSGFSVSPYMTENGGFLVIAKDRMDHDGNLATTTLLTVGPMEVLK